MPVTDDADKSWRLFGIGDEVITEQGPGIVVDIIMQAAKYYDGVELDPPAIVVELEDGTEIHTCMCSIELPDNEEDTELIHSEFDRIWPPKTEGVPEDADSMIPEGEEDAVADGDLREGELVDFVVDTVMETLGY